MGLSELLHAIEEEAAREARAVRADGARRAERLVGEARAAADAAVDARLERARADAAAAAAAAREERARARERALLVARRRALEELRARAEEALPALAGPALDARLLGELWPELQPGPATVIVDPGAEDAARAALAALPAGASARVEVVGAASPRGGVEVRQGAASLDDTLPARLARAWELLEDELAERLVGEEGPWPGSTG